MQKFVFILILITTPLLSGAQENFTCCRPFHSLHLGFSIIDQNFDDRSIYRPAVLLYYNSIPLTKRNSENVFAFYYEPQLNPIIFRKRLKIEFGINGGLSYNRKLSDGLNAYISVGTGPHYINTVTERQAQGFLFSDNVMIGLRKQLPSRNHHYELNIQYRFRHISNAGLSYPNQGINNGFLILGITKVKRLKPHIEG